MINMTEKLRLVMLYCETQGDKFRGFGYELAAFLKDDNNAEAVKEARAREVVGLMRDSFSYHADYIQQMLDYPEED